MDKDNYVVYEDEQYRAQGEHLKPLEYTICALQDLPPNILRSQGTTLLKPGKVAPDVDNKPSS